MVLVAQDEASLSLGGEAKRSLEQIGSTLIHQLGIVRILDDIKPRPGKPQMTLLVP